MQPPLGSVLEEITCVKPQIFPRGQEKQISLIFFEIFEMPWGLLTMGWSHTEAPARLVCPVCLAPPFVPRNGLRGLQGPLAGMSSASRRSPGPAVAAGTRAVAGGWVARDNHSCVPSIHPLTRA